MLQSQIFKSLKELDLTCDIKSQNPVEHPAYQALSLNLCLSRPPNTEQTLCEKQHCMHTWMCSHTL